MNLEQAYMEAGPRIVGYLVMAGADEATARDLLHDAVVRVAKRLAAEGEVGGNHDLGALLFVTARNLMKNLVRDGRWISIVESPEELDVRAIDGQRNAELLDVPYLRRRIAAALAELPDVLRETYTLYQLGNRSVREVAEMTGATENLVKVRLHRAKKSLRKALADIAPLESPTSV